MRNLPQAPSASSKKEDQNKFFLTQKGQAEEGEAGKGGEKEENEEEEEENNGFNFDNPQQMVELLKRIDDATIFLIHNTQEKEEDLEKTRREFELQREQIMDKFNNRKESLAQVQKQFEKLEKVC